MNSADAVSASVPATSNARGRYGRRTGIRVWTASASPPPDTLKVKLAVSPATPRNAKRTSRPRPASRVALLAGGSVRTTPWPRASTVTVGVPPSREFTTTPAVN